MGCTCMLKKGKMGSSTSGELHTWQSSVSVTLLQQRHPHQHQKRRSHLNQNQRRQKLNEERHEKHRKEEQKRGEILNQLQNQDLRIQDLKITRKIQNQRLAMGQVISMVMICKKTNIVKRNPKQKKSHLTVVIAGRDSAI